MKISQQSVIFFLRADNDLFRVEFFYFGYNEPWHVYVATGHIEPMQDCTVMTYGAGFKQGVFPETKDAVGILRQYFSDLVN